MKKLTVWQAACVITGYGIGGGVLAIPWLVARCGIWHALPILLIAAFVSWLTHMILAEMAQKCNAGTQIVSVFSNLLFRGRWQRFLTLIFFALMTFVLIANLTVFLSGGSEVLAALLPLPNTVCQLLFYGITALPLLFGLKGLGISEEYAVAAIFLLLGTLGIGSLGCSEQSLPTAGCSFLDDLSLFSMLLLDFTCFFSVPQVVEGLGRDMRRIRRAITLGMGTILLITCIITLCTLLTSAPVTEVAVIGWCAAIGPWASVLGNTFTLLAMLTTYWSISMASGDVVREQFSVSHRMSWLLPTLPSLLLVMLLKADFIDALSLAGGAIAVLAALMIVPAYRVSRRENPGNALEVLGSVPFQLLVVVSYVLMAVGAVL